MHATNPTSGFPAILKDDGVIVDAVRRTRGAGINHREKANKDNPKLLSDDPPGEALSSAPALDIQAGIHGAT